MKFSHKHYLEKAIKVAEKAYNPYSNFCVGAVVLTEDGEYLGCNVENAGYGVVLCAECTAISKAVSEGDYNIHTIYVAGFPRNYKELEEHVTPCGRCRQLILEASAVSGKNIKVIACGGNPENYLETTIDELAPYGFSAKNLGIDVSIFRKL